jgi:hypothetical protein
MRFDIFCSQQWAGDAALVSLRIEESAAQAPVLITAETAPGVADVGEDGVGVVLLSPVILQRPYAKMMAHYLRKGSRRSLSTVK